MLKGIITLCKKKNENLLNTILKVENDVEDIRYHKIEYINIIENIFRICKCFIIKIVQYTNKQLLINIYIFKNCFISFQTNIQTYKIYSYIYIYISF